MKSCKVISALIIVALLMSSLMVTPVFAHEDILEVDYDICNHQYDGDGIHEAWYSVFYGEDSYHIGHEVTTIKYYFVETYNSYTWSTDMSEAEADAIKAAFVESMEKWNEVYFYSYNSEGNVTKQKIINVVEGTENDHNLSILPVQNHANHATIESVGDGEIIGGNDNHKHYSHWNMLVNVVDYNIMTTRITEGSILNSVEAMKAYTGAHELGHVLGLYDLDKCCGDFTSTKNHHQEVLMGYGEPIESRAQNITYKDIAGVAITRGFHTDNDHLWIYCGMQNGNHKLLCSICNGIKTVSSLAGYTYQYYMDCLGNHNISSGNMMAVASYGTKDYYKCKYCKYVAPFSSIVEQNYSAPTALNYTYHQYVNQVGGLGYTVIEEHDMSENGCTVCGYVHTHSYGNGIYKNHSMHLARCGCGATQMEPHYVRGSEIVNGRYATCLGCNRELDLLVDQAEIGIYSIVKVSVNGSYILSNGIVVLVDADIEAYQNGTLQFYEPDKLPSVA